MCLNFGGGTALSFDVSLVIFKDGYLMYYEKKFETKAKSKSLCRGRLTNWKGSPSITAV